MSSLSHVDKCLINVDCGEGESGIQRDLSLLPHVDIVNIALGGHAGAAQWSRELARRAVDHGCQVCLHPGYADRAHFGRRNLPLSWVELRAQLDRQRAVLAEVTWLKFHGALYNQAAQDSALARQLLAWCQASDVHTVLAPAASRMAQIAPEYDIHVLGEGFADRRYVCPSGILSLAPRSHAEAVIGQVSVVLAQVHHMVAHQRVRTLDAGWQDMFCQTICIHGDGPQAMDFVRAVRHYLITGQVSTEGK